MSGVEEMIRKVESLLGVKGTPNEATRWYAARNGAYFSTAAWCDMTITWAAYLSGNYEAVCHGTDFAYTVYHAQRFQAKGEWHTDVAGIRRGDIVFFDWAGSNSVGAIDHVGIVTGVQGANILTVEGNTSNQCLRRVRQADTIVGFGRPKYVDVTPLDSTPAAPPKTVPIVNTITLTQVQPGKSNSHVLVVQKALRAEVGLDFSSGPGVFGPKTKTAYSAWQRKLGYSGVDANGVPGKASLTKLGLKYGFRVS